jgi:hypothetical protein
LRTTEREKNEFQGRGAAGNFGNCGDQSRLYNKRLAELNDEVKALEKEVAKIRYKRERFQAAELTPVASALYRRELEVFGQLMSNVDLQA